MPAKKVTDTNAAKKAPAKEAAVKKVATKKTAAKKATATAKVPAKKAAKNPAAKKAETTIVATTDVGMGNHVTIRGDGPGLSWVNGAVMENVDSQTWKWTTSAAKSAFEVKFLVNDEKWAQGENEVIKPGTTTGVFPVF